MPNAESQTSNPTPHIAALVVSRTSGCVLLTSYFLLPALPAAAQVDTGIEFGTATGLTTRDIRLIVAEIIRIAIGLLGLVALVIVVYGGYLWMTAGGDTEKLTDAKKWLINGAIGLAIILLSFSITQFVISRLTDALYGSGSVQTASGGVPDISLSGALGAGPIESHYPARGATDIPRNARIFITFREPIAPASIADDTNGNGTIGTTGSDATQFDNYRDLARPEAIQIVPVGVNIDPTKLTPSARTSDPEAFASEASKLTPVGVAIAADQRTVVLAPIATEVVSGQLRAKENSTTGFVERAFLGNPRTPTAYLVRLAPVISKASSGGASDSIFVGAFRDGYAWDFTVSTTLDLTPPKIIGVFPPPDAGRDTATGVVGAPDQPQNAVVQVHFDEPVDPTVTTGTVRVADVGAAATDAGLGFRHLGVAHQGKRVTGTFTIGNQYRTVEFTSDRLCGQNSCGGDVFCLPGEATLTAWADAATLEAGGPAGIPFSGVMDAAGNSLDGDSDGHAEGPGDSGVRRFTLGASATANAQASDSVGWSFVTNNTIDLTAPTLDEVVHYARDGSAVRIGRSINENIGLVGPIAISNPVELLFSKLMSANVTGAVRLEEVINGSDGCDAATGQGCLWFSAGMANEPVGASIKTRVTIDHAPFREADPGFDPPLYRARVDAVARDVYQNCFFSTDTPVGPRGPIGGERCIAAGDTDCQTVGQ
ncbi:MAG: hypothetical protein V1723_03635 [Candidatus Uhrbacteria bacterium]